VLCGLLLFGAAGAARAQLSGHVAVLSDYRYRGVSQSDGEPSVQGGLDYQHASGIFLGAVASRVRYEPYLSGVHGQFYAGYARALNQFWSWEAGILTNLYPRPAFGPSYNYTEAFAGVTYENISARGYIGDGNLGAGGHPGYVEINASHALGARVNVLGHLGYATHRELPFGYSGQGRSFFDFKIGLVIEIYGFNLELSITETTASERDCPAGSGRCGATGIVSISRSF
jgi:uncharacterized protein (TIGR02001 family)